MTFEEMERAMDFIAAQTAKHSVNIDKLLESHRSAERRLDRTERLLKLMIRAGRRERQTRSEADERLTRALVELAEAQKKTEASIAHTDVRLDALIDVVRQQRNGQS